MTTFDNHSWPTQFFLATKSQSPPVILKSEYCGDIFGSPSERLLEDATPPNPLARSGTVMTENLW